MSRKSLAVGTGAIALSPLVDMVGAIAALQKVSIEKLIENCCCTFKLRIHFYIWLNLTLTLTYGDLRTEL